VRSIPSNLFSKSSQTEKRGEELVYSLLKDINLSKNDVLLHSLNLDEGVRQDWSEIDFLIISQRGIIGIEVKGGPVKFADGYWYVYSDKSCRNMAYRKRKSPHVQVSNALDTLKSNWLRDLHLGPIPYLKLAILCQNERRLNDFAEMQSEYHIFEEDLLHQTNLKNRINEALDYFIEHHNKKATLNDDQIKTVIDRLRPEIDKPIPDYRSHADAIELAQEAFTKEQFDTMDYLSIHDRLIIDGGAGTGKTFLLQHSARTENDKSTKVGIYTRAKGLISKFNKVFFNNKNTSIINPDIAGDLVMDDYFDIVYVDEGQDLCNLEYIEIVDKSLKNGLEKGKWRWFGDFENQFYDRGNYDEEVLKLLKSYTANDSINVLTRNVRNTPQIVQSLTTVTKARIGTTVKGNGKPPKSVKAEDIIEEISKHDPNYDVEVCILHPDKIAMDELLKLDWASELAKKGAQVSSIDDFKGMESRLVVVFGLELSLSLEEFIDLYYKSISRAKVICYYVHHPNIDKYLIECI